jgi:Dit-like tail protein
MSLATLAYDANVISTVASQTGFLNTFVGQALFQNRNIGGFVADITLSERIRDEMVITQHPIEIGSTITDHAYKLPISAIITCGWSNSTLNIQSASFLGLAALNVLQGGGFSFGDFNYIKQIYQNFLAMQQNAIPFSVTTGKRQLNNMLIKYIQNYTDEKTENCLILEIGLQEAIMVFSQSVQNPSGTNNPSFQSNPQSTGGTQQLGQQNTSPFNYKAPLQTSGNYYPNSGIPISSL